MSGRGIVELLGKEWLLTNSRGGYSSSTVVACNTRRYHGLLTGSLNPPVNRIVGLNNCLEMVIIDGEAHYLSTFEFRDKFAPEGYGHIKRFRRDTGVHWDFEVQGVELKKSVWLHPDEDTVAVVYDVKKVPEPVDIVLRPFVGLRDFHALQKSYARLLCLQNDEGVVIRHDTPESCQLFMRCPAAGFENDPQWWFNFLYRVEERRGQDFLEDLWSPGFYKCRVQDRAKIVLWANLGASGAPDVLGVADIELLCRDVAEHQEKVLRSAKRDWGRIFGGKEDKDYKKLCLAAYQFVTRRQTVGQKGEYGGNGEAGERTTILAGFPWFADWGRDAFISLPGLLLCTGRLEEARSVLTTFAAAADEGMIPNRFDDHSNTAHFNSIDASLWFINAAFDYLEVTEDSETFRQRLLPVIGWIIDAYQKGTRFGTHADKDGLITGGDEHTQLTWMDAMYAGVAFTPRYGKAVEVNALWYNALCRLARFYANIDSNTAGLYHSMADKVECSFCEAFWNERGGYLNDCVMPDGRVDHSIRPNQIFAVSLPFSPLSDEQQRSVVTLVERELLTPYGLRTLNRGDNRYRGRYMGSPGQRDEAYHQGTVWPYLLGAFVEAYLKVNDFSRESRGKARAMMEPLMRHLTEDGCLGSVSEIFDGDEPQMPRGCFAQAWSVAELIRIYRMVNEF